MFRMFAAFENWCKDNDINPEKFEITITPFDTNERRRFESAMTKEFTSMQLKMVPYEMPPAGKLYGIPFKFDKASS